MENLNNKIIHICDDEKFINNANYLFEKAFPKRNLFIVFGSFETKLIHVSKDKNVVILSKNEIIKKLESFKGFLIFHSLQTKYLGILNRINHVDVSTIWLAFGFETYSDPNLYSNKKLYDKITYLKYGKKTSIKDNMFYRNLYRKIKKGLVISKTEERVHLTQKIDYLGASFVQEYKLLSRIYDRKFKFFEFWYYPLEKIVDINHCALPLNNTILLGNSASITNNHLDVLDKLTKNKINKNLVLPLSYGEVDYRNDVINEFKVYEKDVFILKYFMSIKEYNKIISSCKFAIFNTRRQQAVGNIIALLWYGAKIFISEKNTFYGYLKSLRIIVFSYEKDLKIKKLRQGLSETEILNNRKILMNFLSEDNIVKQMKKSLKDVS